MSEIYSSLSDIWVLKGRTEFVHSICVDADRLFKESGYTPSKSMGLAVRNCEDAIVHFSLRVEGWDANLWRLPQESRSELWESQGLQSLSSSLRHCEEAAASVRQFTSE